jgi:small subunit ribosomal protein S1
VVEKGKQLECRVLSVDQDRRRIALGLKQLGEDPWETDIPRRYEPGQIVKGPVTKITNFGVFVGLEDGLEGLLHISELADHKVDNPEEVVKVGEEIEVKILRVDPDERKIGLSRKRVEWAEEAEAKAEEAAAAGPSIPEAELKGGVGQSSGPLIKPIEPRAEEPPAEESPAEEPPVEEPSVAEGKPKADSGESTES